MLGRIENDDEKDIEMDDALIALIGINVSAQEEVICLWEKMLLCTRQGR